LAPLFLNRFLGVAQNDLGRLLWVPPLGWEAGYFFWGWIADRFAALTERPLPALLALSALGLPLAAVTRVSSPAAAALVFSWAMFIAAGFIVAGLRTGARAYPQGQTALVAGMAAGSWSALVAVLLPVLGDWFDRGLFSQTFLAVALMPAAGTLAWGLLRRTRTALAYHSQ
jgi:ACS family hexuronate transporter-like MFS transporter